MPPSVLVSMRSSGNSTCAGICCDTAARPTSSAPRTDGAASQAAGLARDVLAGEPCPGEREEDHDVGKRGEHSVRQTGEGQRVSKHVADIEDVVAQQPRVDWMQLR